MKINQILRKVELFDGLLEHELNEVAAICHEKHLKQGEVIAVQGDPGNELFIVAEGFLEILLADSQGESSKVLANLGAGQIIGEIAMLDHGPRSATVRAIKPTIIQVIPREAFEELCQKNLHIGYVIMRNIATDLSFKLRHLNLIKGG